MAAPLQPTRAEEGEGPGGVGALAPSRSPGAAEAPSVASRSPLTSPTLPPPAFKAGHARRVLTPNQRAASIRPPSGLCFYTATGLCQQRP